MDAAKAHTSGSWHDIKVAAIYSGKRGADGFDEATELRYEAIEEGFEAFGRRVGLSAALQQLALDAETIGVGRLVALATAASSLRQ